jgi:hypothetical protein
MQPRLPQREVCNFRLAFRKIGPVELLRLPDCVGIGMNQITLQRMVLPADRNRVQVAAHAMNADKFEGYLEKYEHLEELTELFFAARRHHLNVPALPQP